VGGRSQRIDAGVDTGFMIARIVPSLRLLRAAVVSVGSPPIELESTHLGRGDAFVQSGRAVRVDGDPVGNIVLAVVPVESFDLGKETFDVPADARRDAETMIETLARLLALRHRTNHSISSPMPFIGFASDDPRELASLEGKRFAGSVLSGIGPGGQGGPDTTDPKILAGLQDRLDGVALLAEALSHGNALGRYHELIRLFERAFARKAGSLGPHLVPFLMDKASPHGFTKKEIHRWVEARPKASHADHRPEFLLEADVRPWMQRMVEAGYDVLLNKADWHGPATGRRDLWRPPAGSLDAESGLFMTQGHETTLLMQFLDGFGAYPLLLAGPIDSLLPDGLWLEGGKDGGELRMIERPREAAAFLKP
jgi:hypothetical protein